MLAAKKPENVPKAMQEKFERVAAISDNFCKEYLNNEYAQLFDMRSLHCVGSGLLR